MNPGTPATTRQGFPLQIEAPIFQTITACRKAISGLDFPQIGRAESRDAIGSNQRAGLTILCSRGRTSPYDHEVSAYNALMLELCLFCSPSSGYSDKRLHQRNGRGYQRSRGAKRKGYR